MSLDQMTGGHRTEQVRGTAQTSARRSLRHLTRVEDLGYGAGRSERSGCAALVCVDRGLQRGDEVRDTAPRRNIGSDDRIVPKGRKGLKRGKRGE